MSCIFCKIASGEIPAEIVLKTSEVTVFKDIQAQAPVHLLVIPNKHVENVSSVEDAKLFSTVFSAIQTVIKQEKIDAFRVVINNGAAAGQSVFHWHTHILAGRPLNWPPG